MSKQAAGSDYVAVSRLRNAAGETLAMPGERCDRVPETSLDWLLAGGRIRHEPRQSKPAKAEKKG